MDKNKLSRPLIIFYHLLYISSSIKMVFNNQKSEIFERKRSCLLLAFNIFFTILQIIKLLKYDMVSFNSSFFHSRLRVRFQNTAISWNGISVTLIYIQTHYDKMHTISIKDKSISKYTRIVQLE